MISEAVKPVYEILAAMLLVTIMLITLQNPKNLSLFLTFIFILYRLQPKVKTFDSYRVALRSLSPAVEETSSVLYISRDDHTISPKVPLKGLNRGINFDNVTFYYNPFEKPTISNLSMSIPAGKTTAVVGPSGAGKTTLTKLILRLYDPSEGKILIDDVPLDEIDLTMWRQRIALVSQDVFLFNTSVFDNIAYGNVLAKKEDVYRASKLADAHSFICKLPKGYESIVGDRGARLSGGQQQRIALARALVRDPDILILDEATNALDGISIQLINTALANFKKNRTVIIIAHRFTSVTGIDHIVVMQEGCICEQGGLQSLLDSDGLFARLYGLELRHSDEKQN
jgi:subfamily B ATP-binding cassette protein MsbA